MTKTKPIFTKKEFRAFGEFCQAQENQRIRAIIDVELYDVRTTLEGDDARRIAIEKTLNRIKSKARIPK